MFMLAGPREDLTDHQLWNHLLSDLIFICQQLSQESTVRNGFFDWMKGNAVLKQRSRRRLSSRRLWVVVAHSQKVLVVFRHAASSAPQTESHTSAKG